MSGDEPYGVLGLRPGARRVEVDQAYRRLIKQYHPDRTGGDGGRAAEINRAYTLIRQDMPAGRRGVPMPIPPGRRPSSRRWGWAMACAVAVAGAVAFAGSDSSRRASNGVPALILPSTEAEGATVSMPLSDFDEPLQTAMIDRSIADAVKFHSIGDPRAAVEFTRACHNALRDKPSLAWFDSCAAFDEATVALDNDDPLAASGPFSPPAVMGRHMAAARLLSDDMLAAESRLHQIRARVEWAMVPAMDGAAPQKP
ncbi:MAG TPA: J domain-containing protein [Sphingomicrobium sp.]|nr:J domain-containing protein [Sphingomicrobium sp.]